MRAVLSFRCKFVQQVWVVDAEHLVLEQSCVELFAFLLLGNLFIVLARLELLLLVELLFGGVERVEV